MDLTIQNTAPARFSGSMWKPDAWEERQGKDFININEAHPQIHLSTNPNI
jgi:hypothetical protein